MAVALQCVKVGFWPRREDGGKKGDKGGDCKRFSASPLLMFFSFCPAHCLTFINHGFKLPSPLLLRSGCCFTWFFSLAQWSISMMLSGRQEVHCTQNVYSVGVQVLGISILLSLKRMIVYHITCENSITWNPFLRANLVFFYSFISREKYIFFNFVGLIIFVNFWTLILNFLNFYLCIFGKSWSLS